MRRHLFRMIPLQTRRAGLWAGLAVMLAAGGGRAEPPEAPPALPTGQTTAVVIGEGIYASFPELFRTENRLIIRCQVQDLDALAASGLHPHYQPVARLQYAISSDLGHSWTVTDEPPVFDRVLAATRCWAPLDDGELLDVRYRHIRGQRGFEPLQARVVADRFEHEVAATNLDQLAVGGGLWVWDVRRLRDGGFLAAAYGPTQQDRPVSVAEGAAFLDAWPEGIRHETLIFLKGTPDGRSWSRWAVMANPHAFSYGEPSFLEFADGRLVALIRSTWSTRFGDLLPAEVNGHGRQRDGYGDYLYQSESTDGGRSWSSPARLPLWGHPPYLLQLRSGNVLLVYGHRRPPFGIRAVLSRDQCRTWDLGSRRTLYTAEADSYDMGYPVALETDDGEIVCVFYGYTGADTSGCSPHAVFVTRFRESDLLGR